MLMPYRVGQTITVEKADEFKALVVRRGQTRTVAQVIEQLTGNVMATWDSAVNPRVDGSDLDEFTRFHFKPLD